MPDQFTDCMALLETNQKAKNGWVEDTNQLSQGWEYSLAGFYMRVEDTD